MVASGVLLINEDKEIGKKPSCINNGCTLERKKKERQAGRYALFKKQNKIKSVRGSEFYFNNNTASNKNAHTDI